MLARHVPIEAVEPIGKQIDNRFLGHQAKTMIDRDLSKPLAKLAAQYPVVTLTGPRQAGKTTLCKSSFPGKPHVSLEALDTRDYACRDPRGFLSDYPDGAILDELQNAPELPSYIQGIVDEDPTPGRFILTGSQHFGLTQAVSQSLAGRTAVLHLMPPSYGELKRFDHYPQSLDEVIWAGAYPRIHDRGLEPAQWLSDYVLTYVQRDVRSITNVTDLEAFTSFTKHCAGRTGCEVNFSALGSDVGIAHNTARAWLSVLEASFLVFRIPSWQRNVRKRLLKAPKLHFVDSGLACYLLGITDPGQLRYHPLRGALFESWVVSEIYKSRLHRALEPRLRHYRDAKGLEVDCIVESEQKTYLVEAKSGATIRTDDFGAVQKLAELMTTVADVHETELYVVSGGDLGQSGSRGNALPWNAIDREW
ncbi:MAG: putative AAA+ superfamily ATPase [Planctomycetota bacterium]